MESHKDVMCFWFALSSPPPPPVKSLSLRRASRRSGPWTQFSVLISLYAGVWGLCYEKFISAGIFFFFFFNFVYCCAINTHKTSWQKLPGNLFIIREKKETRAKGRSEETENGIGERSLCSSAPLLWNICWIIIRALGTQLSLPNIDFIFLLTADLSGDWAVFSFVKTKTAPRSSWFSECQLSKCYYY